MLRGVPGRRCCRGGRRPRVRAARTFANLVEGDGELNSSNVMSHLASCASLPKAEAEAAVDTVLEAIRDGLARGEAMALMGFGTFSTTSREARRQRRLRTSECIDIAAWAVSSSKAGKKSSRCGAPLNSNSN